MKIRHAALIRVEESAYLIYLKDDCRSFGYHEMPLPDQPSLVDLLELAVREPFDRYWVLASAGIEPTKDWAEWDEEAWDLRAAENADDTHIQSIHGWRKPSGGQKSIDLIFPLYTRWAKDRGEPGWAALASPKQFLMALHYIEQALAVDVKGSPSSTGWGLAKQLHPKQITDTSNRRLATMHFDSRSAFDFFDDRIPTSEELGRRYLIKLDKNSAYLAAAASEFYGMGTPVRTTAFSEDAVGVWRITLEAKGTNIPFKILSRLKEERWLATPLVRLLLTTGHELTIHEGYVFQEKYMLLKAWSKRIWDARLALRDPQRFPFENSRRLAEVGVKTVAVATIGITAYRNFRKGEDSDKERPDIKLQTIARNFEIMYHNILKARQEDNVVPVLVNMDCVHLLVDDLDPTKSARSYVIRNGQLNNQNLGGYKPEGWMEVTPDVRAILAGPGTTYGKKCALDALGWQIYG